MIKSRKATAEDTLAARDSRKEGTPDSLEKGISGKWEHRTSSSSPVERGRHMVDHEKDPPAA